MASSDEPQAAGLLSGELFSECAGWIWEQLQDEGYFCSGELVELVLATERELGAQALPVPEIALKVDAAFSERGISADPAPISVPLILAILFWEDDFLSLAGIPRSAS